jgi:hypothetical protein
MPVSVAAGVEVVFDDREPPGVDGAAAVVGVDVAALAVVVVVFVPEDPAVVVVVAAPPAAVVVVVPESVVVVVVLLLDPEASVWLFDDFLEAEGVDEPQAAAINPAATTTPAIRSELARRRPARLGVDPVELVVLGTVVRPRSSWSAYGWSGDHQVRPCVSAR